MARDSPAQVYRFGPFRLEVLERRLLRDGEVVPLSGKPFDTLVQLVEGAGTLQKQQVMVDRLWPDVAVEQNSLQAWPTRLAYARLGEGPPLVKAANWLNHLELDLEGPVWKHWLARLGRDHGLIRYDARGNGLSDWKPPTIRFDDFVSDLGAVFDAAGVRRGPIFAVSQGAAVAVAYAARHPERVSALILVGGCVRGWRVKANPRLAQRFDALMVLMRQGWGAEHAAFRQIFTSSFFPGETAEIKDHLDWFNELQRRTTSPDNAVAILSALGDVDIRADLAQVRVPTLARASSPWTATTTCWSSTSRPGAASISSSTTSWAGSTRTP